jgi:hypothetical protein
MKTTAVVSLLQTKYMDGDKKVKQVVGISITSFHVSGVATATLNKLLDLYVLLPGVKFCSWGTLPRTCQQTAAGPQVVAKYPDITQGWYLIQSQDPLVPVIDFQALLSNFEEAVSIPGLLRDVKLLFNRKTVLGACYRDLDDFINKKKKPALCVDLTSAAAAAVRGSA